MRTFASNTWADAVQANRAAVDGFTSIFDSTSRTLFITGYQMEIGATATEFESSTYGDELALCQRYYETSVGSPAGSSPAAGTASSGNVQSLDFGFSVTKRASPTMGYQTGTAWQYFNGTSWVALTTVLSGSINGFSVQGNTGTNNSTLFRPNGAIVSAASEL